MKRIANLDGLRGIAVLIVFLSHTSGRGMAMASWLDFQGIGHVGVYLFFVLSGFLLTRNLIGGQLASTFYLRRFFRIAPLYFLVLIGVLIFGNNPMYLHVDGAVAHFLFLKGDGVFWSVAAEFGFYLLLPVIVRLIERFRYAWVAVLSVAYFVWSLGAQFHGWLPLKFVDIVHSSQYLDVFLCGVLAAYVRREPPPRLTAMAFWGLLLITLMLVSKDFMGIRYGYFNLRWWSLLYGIVFAAGTVSCAQGNKYIPVGNRLLMFVGTVGFGWYLLHLAVFQVINEINIFPPVKFFVAFALCAFVSWIAYRCVEKPGMSFGRWIERRVARTDFKEN